jgi:NAD(P)H-dependent FMN reductase
MRALASPSRPSRNRTAAKAVERLLARGTSVRTATTARVEASRSSTR